MKHAEKLIARVLFLEGRPIVSELGKINIGADVEKQLASDRDSEAGAVKAYNTSIKIAVELGDNGTRDLLQGILKDEEDHIDWLEAQLEQIAEIGIQNYLERQV